MDEQKEKSFYKYRKYVILFRRISGNFCNIDRAALEIARQQ